jgi:hypothetical protein
LTSCQNLEKAFAAGVLKFNLFEDAENAFFNKLIRFAEKAVKSKRYFYGS